jgi:uncharacterized integral membrane protein
MRVVRRLAGIALFAALLILGWRFAAANSIRVPIDYLAGELPDLALWAALAGAFLGGAALAGALGLYQIARLALVGRRYRKLVRSLEAELQALRPPPGAGAAPRGEAGAEGSAAEGPSGMGGGA